MTWTGIATDLTLTDVIGPPTTSSPAPRFASFTKPPPHVSCTEDMLPPPARSGPRLGSILLLLAALGTAALAILKEKPAAPAAVSPATVPADAPSPAAKPAPRKKADTKAKRTKQVKRSRADEPRKPVATPAPDELDVDTGDLDIETFRQLSGKT